MKVLNCIKFQPKIDTESEIFKFIAKHFLNPPLEGMQDVSLINNAEGEYSLVAEWTSIEAFLKRLNSDKRIIDILRPYVIPYEDGEHFHAWSGPSIDLKSYLP